MKISEIRADFPILKRKINGKRLVYLDNAATTQKPKAVIDAIKNYYESFNSNIHRAVHTLAEESTEAYENTREKVAGFVNGKSHEIVFTRSTTESLNLVAYSLLAGFEKGSEILVTEMEHHSNFVPWQQACKFYGLKFNVANVNKDAELDMEDFEDKLTNKTKLVAVAHVSNVTGIINNVKEIAETAKEKDVIVAVDGAQAVQSSEVDVKDLGADFYAFSGHKMLAPMGIGVLFGSEEFLEKMRPFNMGGGIIKRVRKDETTWNDIPNKFEAGTQNVEGVVGLSVAIDYLKKIGFDSIKLHEKKIAEKAFKEISSLKDVTVYGGPKRKPIISFNVGDIHPHDVATYLDKFGVAVRAGNHCAAPLMDVFGINGNVRASFYIYNDEDDLDVLIKAIEEARRFFAR
ncbi:MAG: SufS family cysteine desulfurase [Nanoarchaeota archaeon]